MHGYKLLYARVFQNNIVTRRLDCACDIIVSVYLQTLLERLKMIVMPEAMEMGREWGQKLMSQ